jgi:UvrD-like helicase C-terminal domain
MATSIPALGACASRMTGIKTTMASPSSNPSAAAAKDRSPSSSNFPACAKKPLRLQTHLAQGEAHKEGFALGDMAILYPDYRTRDLYAQVLHQRQMSVEMRRSPCDFDPTSDTIKVMTMKVSKGLEVPVVALPGVRHMPAKGEDEKDAARVFYVAVTRATQKLFVGVSGNGWFSKKIGCSV